MRSLGGGVDELGSWIWCGRARVRGRPGQRTHRQSRGVETANVAAQCGCRPDLRSALTPQLVATVHGDGRARGEDADLRCLDVWWWRNRGWSAQDSPATPWWCGWHRPARVRASGAMEAWLGASGHLACGAGVCGDGGRGAGGCCDGGRELRHDGVEGARARSMTAIGWSELLVLGQECVDDGSAWMWWRSCVRCAADSFSLGALELRGLWAT